MKKELLISAKFDTSDFDKSVESMQKKLKELYAPADMVRMQTQTAGRMAQAGMGGMMSAPTPDAAQRNFAQTRREMDAFIKEQATGQEKLVKLISKRQEKLDQLKKQQSELIKGSQKELEIKEKIGRIEDNNARLRDQYRQRDVALNKALNLRENVPSGPGGGGPGGGPGGGGPGGGPQGAGFNLGAVLKGVSGILAALSSGAAIYQQYQELPMQRSQAQGAGTQSLLGQQLQDISGGDVVNQMAFMPERQKALQMATDAMKSKEITDPVILAGTAGISGIISGVFGDKRLWNLMAGSVTGAIATNLPKSAFGGMPGVKSLAGAAGKISEEYMSTYQSQLIQEYGKNYQQLVDAEIKKNPLKALAAKRLNDNYQQDVQTQRMLGLSDTGMFGKGGFQESANMAGFNPDLARAMAGQIQAGGGSTRGMRGTSVLGLQAQRGFDLTNAGNVLGRISGGAGSSQATETVFKKLLEESVKAGLDKSEFREEQRKFADITSEILGRSGARTAEDAEQLLKGFSRFLGGEPTMRGMEGAKSAYEEAQKFSAETSGRGGALQFAGMMRNEKIAPIGYRGIAGLMETPEQDLTATNPFIISEAVKAGITPEELIKQVRSEKRNKAYVEIGLEPKKAQALNQYLKDKGMQDRDLSYQEVQALPKDMREAYHELQEATTIRSGYESPQKRQAVFRGLLTGMDQTEPGKEQYGPTEIDKKLAETGDRSADEVIKSVGVANQAMLENFRNFKKEITPAAEALDSFTKKIMLMAQVMNMVPDADKAATMKGVAEQLSKGMAPKVQPQVGRPGQ